MTYRRDIEGLRALAVVAVLLYHFGVPGLGGGFVGVDVFFVISGYLITSLLTDERTRTGRVSILRFYARRARRLLPISTLVVVITAAAGTMLLSPTALDALGDEVVAAAGFAANALFAHRGTDYLTASLDPSPLLHYWSLAVEEQFYVVWPALVALVSIGASTASAVRRRVAVSTTVIVVASFTASALLTTGQPSWSYFGLHTRAWELGVGALLAVVAPRTDRLPASLRAVLGWAGVAGIAVCAALFGSVDAFPGWAAVVPVLAPGAVLVAGDATTAGPVLLLRHRVLGLIGTRSYSLYLWHWPALILAEARHGGPLSPVARTMVAIGVVAIAELGYRLVEHPIRTATPLLTHPRRSVALGAGLVVVGLIAGLATTRYRPDLSTGIVAAAPDAGLSAASTSTTSPPSTVATDLTIVDSTSTSTTEAPPPLTLSMADAPPLQAILDALDATVVPDNLRPPLLGAKNDVGSIYDDGCHQYLRSTVRTDCVVGAPDGDITIALWGDSHAAQWFTAVEAMAEAHGWRLLSLTQGGCPFLDVEVYNVGADSVFTHCGPWRAAVRRYMRDESVDAVLVSQYYALRSASDRSAIPASDWQLHLPPLLDSLRADGITPIILGDTPDPAEATPACLADHRQDVLACAPLALDPRAVEIDSIVRSIATQREVSFFEPRRLLCGAELCPPIVGDLLVYRDENHLTDTFVAWLAPVFDEFVAPFVERAAST